MEPQWDKGAPSAPAVGQVPSSNNMLGLQWGAQASYSPYQAGRRGPCRISQDSGIQLMVGVFGMATASPVSSRAGCSTQGVR